MHTSLAILGCVKPAFFNFDISQVLMLFRGAFIKYVRSWTNISRSEMIMFCCGTWIFMRLNGLNCDNYKYERLSINEYFYFSLLSGDFKLRADAYTLDFINSMFKQSLFISYSYVTHCLFKLFIDLWFNLSIFFMSCYGPRRGWTRTERTTKKISIL